MQIAYALNESMIYRNQSDMNRSALTDYRGDPRVGAGYGFGPVVEGNKLNLLIEEYRKENDRCSNRI